jgi:arsenate reductase
VISLPRRAFAEFLGTAFLVAVVVGSGIMAVRLSPHDVGLQLLENAFATGAGLIALILAFGSVSGAHFNPVVSLVDWRFGGLRTKELGAYVGAQVSGAAVGCIVANVMFDLPAVDWSTNARGGTGILLGEVVATIGLLLVIFGTNRTNQRATPFAVGAYIAAAYFFTSSTSFANPAVTIGRAFSDTFAGIAPDRVPAFIGVQLVGAVVGLAVIVLLFRTVDAADVVVPHEPELS